MGDAAAQLRRRRRAVPGQPDSGGGDQPGRAATCSTCIRSATSRRRSIARRWSARNDSDQAGGRVDVNASSSDQIFARYSYSGGHNVNPISVRGTDVPGFPTRDDLATHSAAAVGERTSSRRR